MESKQEDTSKLSLWMQVCTTPPEDTKKVAFGARKFTSVDPQKQLKVATALWGPYGGLWALLDLNYSTLMIGEKPSLVLSAEFSFPGGKFPIAVDMPLKNNDDAYKKLLTSARSKALSMLGFNSDVFEGQYDDDRYVAEMTGKYGEQDELRVTVLTAIRNANTQKVLNKCRQRVDELFANNSINKALRDECLEAIDITTPNPSKPTPGEQEQIREQERREAGA